VAIKPQIARIVPSGNISPHSLIRQDYFSRAGFFATDVRCDRLTARSASSHGMILSILERHGFLKVRQRGSHIVMQLRFEGGTTTVPVPDHTSLFEPQMDANERR
jgi:hypothetical protein